jgi:hypothetical protein
VQRLIATMAAANRTWGEERIAAELLVSSESDYLRGRRSRAHVRRTVVSDQTFRTVRAVTDWRRVAVTPILGGLHYEYRLEQRTA